MKDTRARSHALPSLPSETRAAARFDVTCHEGTLFIEAHGWLTSHGLQTVLDETYPKHVFERVLWDLTRTDASGLTNKDLAAIAAKVRKVVPTQNRKTAYVVSDRKAFSRACAYLNHTFLAGIRVEYKVFFSLEEAQHWLLEPHWK